MATALPGTGPTGCMPPGHPALPSRHHGGAAPARRATGGGDEHGGGPLAVRR
jgi:hypothetical protein